MNTFVVQLRVTGSTVASYVEVESALAWTAMAPRYAIEASIRRRDASEEGPRDVGCRAVDRG